MASNSGVQQQQIFQQPAVNPHHCKECGLYMNSAESLEVHLRYHKDNSLNKWATQATTPHADETNNNNNTKVNIKREFISNTIAAAADSSDSMLKKSPEYGSRATPESSINFGHPPTPQSYHSASSPYQSADNSAFSPGFSNYQPIKNERTSPIAHFQPYGNFPENQFFMESSQQQQQSAYPQDFPMHKVPVVQNAPFRYHPYQQQTSPYDRTQSQTQVSSSSPAAYPPQPTPSPSPKQCDKCGYVCESATQLTEHISVAHPPTPATYQQNHHFMFGHQEVQIKTEEDAQSEILDLDSHKVHQVYQEEDKRQNGEHNPHSVSGMLNSWQGQRSHRLFINGTEQKLYQQQQQEQQKLFQPHQIHSPDYISNNVSTTSQENMNGTGLANLAQPNQNYRPFENLPQNAAPVISSTQIPNNQMTTNANPPSTKSANWKSNEARRPKTYNCTACNKWFTSSGHLKRHYNTTLHKNAVKSSGQPDPASLPISAHHHPARDNSSNREDSSNNSPSDDSRGEENSLPAQFERPSSMPGLLQQPPNGPYDRQPAPNIHHPPLHSPMSHNPLANPNSMNLSNGSPPNGEAGPSASNINSRGLLSLTSTPSTPHGFSMGPPMMPMESSQFQMYPNGLAPHVTQATVINSQLPITGEFQYCNMTPDTQPLPSFAQFQAHRYGILVTGYGTANVGGGGPVTAPYTLYPDQFDTTAEPEAVVFRQEDDGDYKIAVLTAVPEEAIIPYSPEHHNNNVEQPEVDTKIDEDNLVKIKFENQPASPEKARIKRDYEESTGSPLISSTVQAKQPGVHKCFDCDKIFNKACYLTQHNKTFHSGDKPFKCSRCGKRFSCEKQYQDHLTKHAGDKPYKCDLCPKQFNHKTDLRRHMCLHTGQKPYACDTCGKGFIRKDHMLKHCETHTRKPHSKVAAIR